MKRWRVVAAWLGGVVMIVGVGLAAWLLPRSSHELVLVDFAATFDQAERYCQPEMLVDGSSETQTRFLDWRWLTLDKRAGGPRSVGPVAGLLLPTLPQDAELEIDVEPVGDASGGPYDMQVGWTGGELDRFEARGRVRRRVKMPARVLGMGINPVQIASAGARFVELHGARLSPADKGDRREPWYPLGSFCRGQGDNARIFQVPGARLAYSVRLPARAALSFRVPPGLRRSVIVETADGTEHKVFDSADDPAEKQTVPLRWSAGAIIRIHFRATPSLNGGKDLAEWVAPRLVAPTPGPTRDPDLALPRQPNIVVYVMDAMRADHLQPYGYPRDTSPRIAEFARQAITFERAFAHSVWTKPSVASLITGLLPHEHGAMYDTAQMSPDVSTLAERLSRLGYTCLAYQANDNADYRRGYALYRGQKDLIGLTHWRGSDSSRLIYDRIKADVDRLREPFFLFIQSVDPHYPYGSPDKADRSFVQGNPLDGEPVTAVFHRWQARMTDETEAHRLETSYLIGLYDSGIRHNDRWFGALIELLQARGVYDRTAMLLTADHGEAFRDHGYEQGHGAFFQHTLRVPLILKLPGPRQGRRSSVPVQHLDVVPTALALAGARDPSLSGTSLLASLAEAPSPPRTLYAVHGRDRVIHRFSTEGRAVVSWPYKLIQADVWRPLFQLYDLETDPDEHRNLWPGTPSLPPTIAYLMTEMERPPMAPVRGGADLVFTPEQMEGLRALGYVQ